MAQKPSGWLTVTVGREDNEYSHFIFYTLTISDIYETNPDGIRAANSTPSTPAYLNPIMTFLLKPLKNALLALAFAFPLVGHASLIEIQLNYANTVGSKIQFDGKSHFTFTPAHNNINIIAGGSATGLLGEITGTYTIGNVTKTGQISNAAVTGVGTFVIHDGHGFNLTGTLSWLNILQAGSGDALNTMGAVNITNFTYGGLNTTLKELAAIPSTASDVLAFQFLPAKTLAQLKANKLTTSFNGSIYAERMPDGGSVALLLGTSLLALGVWRRRHHRT
jgi:hypothetical protein